MFFKSLQEFKNATSIDYTNDSQLCFLVGQDSHEECKELIEYLNEKGKKFFGGIYPRLIANGNVHSRGFVVKEVKPVYSELVLPFLMKKLPELDPNKKYTGILIGDSLDERNHEIIETIQSKVKADINFFGGDAASHRSDLGMHSLEQNKLIFNNDGFVKDALNLCIIEQESRTEVKFGWQILDGPFKIKRTSEKIVSEFDYEDPFEFYRDKLEEVAGAYVVEDDVFFHAATYAFGFVKDGNIENVRIPMQIADGSKMQFAHEIMQDDKMYLIKADKQAFLDEVDTLGVSMDNMNEQTLVFACLSREMALEEDYVEEIKLIDRKGLYKCEGALVAGEYSNRNEDKKLRIHEGACVISRI